MYVRFNLVWQNINFSLLLGSLHSLQLFKSATFSHFLSFLLCNCSLAWLPLSFGQFDCNFETNLLGSNDYDQHRVLYATVIRLWCFVELVLNSRLCTVVLCRPGAASSLRLASRSSYVLDAAECFLKKNMPCYSLSQEKKRYNLRYKY
jgi:hypothetical protein